MAKNSMFVSNRDITVSSTLGHTLEFKKGVATHVPPIMRKVCIEKGILPVEGVEEAVEMLEAAEAGPKLHLAPEDVDDRKEAIEKACRAIAKSNNARDFTSGGTPNATAVTAVLGWKVDQIEIREVWKELRVKMKGE